MQNKIEQKYRLNDETAKVVGGALWVECVKNSSLTRHPSVCECEYVFKCECGYIYTNIKV